MIKEFFKLSKQEQADLIWEELFVKRSPISEACQGVITTLKEFGLEHFMSAKKLQPIREWTEKYSVDEYVENVNKESSLLFMKPINLYIIHFVFIRYLNCQM